MLFQYLKVKDRKQHAFLYIENMNYLDPSVYFSDYNSISILKKHSNKDGLDPLTYCLPTLVVFVVFTDYQFRYSSAVSCLILVTSLLTFAMRTEGYFIRECS